ncbi:MAG: NAD(P)-dependent oxidoreductase, partial [Chloroflexota bacterium]
MKAMLATTHLGEDFTGRLQGTFPDVRFVSAFTPEEQLREIADTEVYIGWPSQEVFRAGKQLKWIHCVGTGVDHVEALQDIAEAGVPLTNSLGPHAEPMGDHTMLFILSLAHQAPRLWEDQKLRRWDTQSYAGRMCELSGSTMGIVGLGGIGRAVARRGLGFGMRVVASDPSPSGAPD